MTRLRVLEGVGPVGVWFYSKLVPFGGVGSFGVWVHTYILDRIG